MARLRPRADTGLLFFDFRWEGKRYRALTELTDTPENRTLLAPKLRQLQESIKRGRLKLASFFPELASPSRRRQPEPVATEVPAPAPTVAATPLAVAAIAAVGITFKGFAETWFIEFKVG